MKNLLEAIKEEQRYIDERMKGIDTSLPDRLATYGYDNLTEYFSDKRNYLFSEWKPDLYRINEDFLADEMENAIIECKYGVYVLVPEKLYAFHGNDNIDYQLCEELDVRVIELNYNGGTIIGSSDDLGIMIVAPQDLNISGGYILENILRIINGHINNAKIVGNDIIMDSRKIVGSMYRNVGEAFIWAAQISFGNYDELISRICNKKSDKTPGRISSEYVTKGTLEEEILVWLRKQ